MIKSITHSFSAQRKIGTFFYHALMIVVSFLMLYPGLWLVASSFKPNGDIFSTATSLFPENFTLEHYINGWKEMCIRDRPMGQPIPVFGMKQRHGVFPLKICVIRQGLPKLASGFLI